MAEYPRRSVQTIRGATFGVGWMIAMALGLIAWVHVEATLDECQAGRVADGTPVAAYVSDVDPVWISAIMVRNNADLRATVLYTVDGVEFRGRLWWTDTRGDLRERVIVGGTIEVYVDRNDLRLIATADGGSTERWRMVAFRPLAGIWVIATTLLCLYFARPAGDRRWRRPVDIQPRVTVLPTSPDAPVPPRIDLMPTWNGYRRADVDAILAPALAALRSVDHDLRGVVAARLESVELRRAFWGYSVHEVDQLLDLIVALLRANR